MALAASACLPFSRRAPQPLWSSDLAPPRLAADSMFVDSVARGALHRAFFITRGRWAIHVLDVDRAACWSPIAVKGGTGGGAIGREKTSEIVRRLTAGPNAIRLAGAVNADFFLFEPPGVPQAAHLTRGEVVAGPADRPVFATDRGNQPWLGVLRVDGRATSGAEALPIVAWNRHARGGIAFFDTHYGPAIDSASGTIRAVLDGPRGGAVVSIDTGGRTTPIPSSGSVLEVGRDAPGDVKSRVLLLARARARFEVSLRVLPIHPMEAVGGSTILVRDSAEVAGLDSAGAVTFAPVRHPRTLVAVAAGGRRLFLITVDGRQPGYSDGMTLRESAQLARDLGATQAINLDGGGSTTMVVARSTTTGPKVDIVNKPSDAAGERPVGNVLAVEARCRGR